MVLLKTPYRFFVRRRPKQWVEAIQEYANITELDAATLNRLIKEIVVHRRVHETPSGNQTYFLYCDQSRNGLTLSTFRDSTLKNMPAGQWWCIIGQTDTLLSVSSRTAGAPRCFSLKSGAIITTPQCKRGCLRAMTYRQADTPLPSKSERSERRRQ